MMTHPGPAGKAWIPGPAGWAPLAALQQEGQRRPQSYIGAGAGMPEVASLHPAGFQARLPHRHIAAGLQTPLEAGCKNEQGLHPAAVSIHSQQPPHAPSAAVACAPNSRCKLCALPAPCSNPFSVPSGLAPT
jgi:hypothetical protein